MPEKKTSTRAVFTAYAKAAWKHPWLLSASLLSMVLAEVTNFVAPLFLRQFIDTLSNSTPSENIMHALLLILAVLALVKVVNWLSWRINDFSTLHAEAHVMQDLYQEAFEKLLRHSHEFFSSNFVGTLTRQATRYARSFEQMYDILIYSFLVAIVYTAGTIGILATRSVILGVGLFAWVIIFVGFQLLTAKKIQPLRLKSSEADSEISGALSDAITNHSVVTTFATFRQERESFKKKVANWYSATMREWNVDAWVNMVQGLLGISMNIGLLYAAFYFWQRGAITIGDFVLIEVYALTLIDFLWGIGRNMRQMYEALANASEMLEIIEKPLDIADKPGAKPMVVREGEVRFNHVRFAYKEGSDVLADFDLEIAPREKVALVGPSGAGKSTITKLLLRLYDVSGGSITIDDQDIRYVTQESVRRAIAFVPQDPVLFHRTLRENIRYGRPDATDEEVREAARQAHCLEFIERYPEGFDALVGERGVKLSGGERQRVAIARAILKGAPILVLDEATSSLDSESEALIQDALKKLMEGKTVIAIAHRLSTVMHMDRIIVMEGGRVVLSGTHDELLAQGSNLYKKLWEIQAGGFITE